MSTLCDSLDCSLPGSSVHGILQVRILEWVAISFFRGSSRLRNQTRVSCIAGRFFTNWATREAPILSLIGAQLWATVVHSLILKKKTQPDWTLALSGHETSRRAIVIVLIITNIHPLLSAKSWAKQFTCFISFNLHSNPKLLLPLSLRGGNWGLEMLSSWRQVTQLEGDRTRTWSQALCLQILLEQEFKTGCRIPPTQGFTLTGRGALFC